jgi:hypothetical protein
VHVTQVHALCRKSWIEVKPVTAERWALGCWVCRLASHVKHCTAPGHFGNCAVRKPKKSQLVKHHESGRHKRSTHQFLQLRGLDAAGDSVAAPSVEEFAQLLQRIRRTELEAPRRGSYRKHTTMAWCLYEAHREVERKVLAKAVCVSLVQDASVRGPLLLTRYVACGPLLQRSSGIMRIARSGKHSGAQHLADAVLGSIREMATKGRKHACMYRPRQKPRRLVAFARHLAAIVEVFVADGAADEQLAGRMLQRHSARASLNQTLPNLRLVVRDKPHAARRLLQRTLPKDTFINEMMKALLWSSGSLARLVQHSAPHQEAFRRHQIRHLARAAKTLKNLSYAEHRFDSTARPLGRMVVHFEALVLTANDIIRERAPKSKDHKGANRALELLNTESMLQLGMVADACEIVVRFVRFLDKECFDISALPCHIQVLQASATDLFIRGGCLKHSGYTRHMLELIRKPRLVLLSGGRPKTLGDVSGPSDSMVARCLGRMTNWWKLAEAVLRAEFPDWDLLLQFSAFHVPRDLAISEGTLNQMRKLSDFLGLDADSVIAEYDHLCPVANKFATQSPNAADCSLRSWQQALAATTSDSRRKRSFPASNLQPVLSRFVAYVGSSSGVEQTFSQCLAQFRHLRNFKGLGLQRILVLAGTRGQPEDADLALYSRARLIWEENFSAPRSKMKMKLRNQNQKAIKRALRAKFRGNTEAAQQRRRERDLRKRLQNAQTQGNVSTPPVVAASATAASRLWAPAQAEELARQNHLQRQRLLDAADVGIVAATDPRDLQAYREKVRKGHQQYLRKHVQRLQARKQHKIVITPGTLTWVGDDDWTVPLQRALRMRHVLRETEFSRARVFVVKDVASPPRLVGLAASLVGGLVVSTAYFVNPPGPALRYNRALRLLRRVWISDGVWEASPLAAKLIKQSVQTAKLDLRGTRWQLIDRAEFSRRAGRGSAAELVALVTPAERLALAARERKHAHSLSSLASSCKRLLVGEGLAGTCGR